MPCNADLGHTFLFYVGVLARPDCYEYLVGAPVIITLNTSQAAYIQIFLVWYRAGDGGSHVYPAGSGVHQSIDEKEPPLATLPRRRPAQGKTLR